MSSLSDIMDIAVSGLEAQRLRMAVTASNIANADSTKTAEGGPYRRRDPIFTATRHAEPFSGLLERKLRTVEVTRVIQDTRAPNKRYDPGHADADAAGFVAVPRVNVVEEMANLMSASRSFEANLAVMRKARSIGEAALQIGR